MKNILSIIILSVAVSFAASAQSTSPRFGTTKSQDNTGRVLTYGWSTIEDVAGNDTLSISPAFAGAHYKLTLTDSCYIKISSVVSCYAADQLKLIVLGSSGGKVKFVSSNVNANGTATLSSVGRGVVSFIFDGVKFTESGRVIQ